MNFAECSFYISPWVSRFLIIPIIQVNNIDQSERPDCVRFAIKIDIQALCDGEVMRKIHDLNNYTFDIDLQIG